MPVSVTTIEDPNHPGVQLMAKIIATINEHNVPHSLALDALLSLYGQIAAQYPCCYAGSVEGLSIQLKRMQMLNLQHMASAAEAGAVISRAAARPAH